MLALGVQRRLERGTTDEEIDELVARYRREHKLLFTVDTLEYLARGGRIGRAAAFAGNLLNVKPILTIRDGEVVPLKRVRGNQKAFAEFRATLRGGVDGLAVAARRHRARGRAGAAARRSRSSSRTCGRTRRSRSRRRSAPSSARTPGPARSASSGSTTPAERHRGGFSQTCWARNPHSGLCW